MPTHSVEIDPAALDEIGMVVAYLEANASREVAARWSAGLLEAISTLRDMPARCAAAPEGLVLWGSELRQLLHGSYRIVFVIRGNRVRVLAVRHGARRPLNAPGDADAHTAPQ